MFEETIGLFGFWALVIAFIYGCWARPDVRVFGYMVGTVVLLIAAVRQFFTAAVLDNGAYWASGIVILAACYLGHLKGQGRL
jgi:hypothetical protein